MRGHRLVGTVAVACVVATACGGTTSSSTSEAKPSPSATSGPRGKTGLALRDYQVGDCVSWPASARAASLSTTTVVQCTSPHFVEIAGQAEVGPEVIDYPTHDEWASIITKACEPIVAGYLGGVLDPRGRFDTHAIHPTRLLWELTNHILNCAVGYRPQRQTESGHSITMTGSALNIYDGGAPVTRQIELAKAVFAAGVPFFGSCWGLQVAVTAAGGEVFANPRGREFGFARRILLSDAGREHRLFAGKPLTFEAPAVHRDAIAALPSGATILASNDYGVQAASFTYGRGRFWGVQYHPEYDYRDIAAAAERYGPILVSEGMFPDPAAVAAFGAELRILQANPSDTALLWKHGLGSAMRIETLRLLEISNWLDAEVLPRTSGIA